VSQIFVFGSNREGRHGRGAALEALKNHGAIYGNPQGLQGRSYAIVTKELRNTKTAVTLEEVKKGVQEFLEFAKNNPQHTFNVTRIGCGLAGFKDSQIAPLFKMEGGLPVNVIIPKEWHQILY